MASPRRTTATGSGSPRWALTRRQRRAGCTTRRCRRSALTPTEATSADGFPSSKRCPPDTWLSRGGCRKHSSATPAAGSATTIPSRSSIMRRSAGARSCAMGPRASARDQQCNQKGARAMARTVITGATGTIGSALSNALMARGDQVVALSRNPSRARAALGDAVEHHAWPDPKQAPPPAEALSGADVVLHLLGEPIAQRWNAQVKREIEESRVLSTRMLVAGLKNLAAHERPSVLVSQSATGYYGAHGDEPLDEDAPAGDDFLAGVVVAWESEAHAIAGDMRVVCTRTGVVLSPSGGALGTMLPFFR